MLFPIRIKQPYSMPLDTEIHHIPRLKGDDCLAPLGRPERIWAVGSLYGRYGALCQLHDHLTQRIRPKDRIVYLGNYLGEHSLWTGEATALMDELIAFRNAVIAIPGFFAGDVVFLKGRGENLFEEALRLPFQKNPPGWLAVAKNYGLECYTNAYGAEDCLETLGASGLIVMNKWSHTMQQSLKHHAGHADFFAHLKSAAHTNFVKGHGQTAFVPAGLHAQYALNLQHELLCWPEDDIEALTRYGAFTRIVRGQGFKTEPPDQKRFVLTLDDGAKMDGTLFAACLDPQGRILEWLRY